MIGPWLAARSARERRLLAGAVAIVLTVALAAAALAVRDEFATLRARLAAHTRELAEVRALARRVTVTRAAPAVDTAEGGSLLAELQSAADAAVGRERIAGMTPVAGTVEEGVAEERVALRIADAGLADCVRLLHALEAGSPARRVARLELRKHPDDPARFDATIEVARPRAAS